MRNGRVSMRDLARELGLSASTVSRALAGHPALSRDTVVRVQELARKLGYRESPEVSRAMSSVRQAQTEVLQGILGLLSFHPPGSQLERDLLDSQIVKGMRQRSQQLGWMLDIVRPMEKGMTPRRLRSILLARNVQGLLLPPPPLHMEPYPFDYSAFMVVAASGANFGALMPTVVPSHWRNAMRVFEHVRERGYRRPLLLIHESIEGRHLQATMGAFALTRELGWWERELPIHRGELTRKLIQPILKAHKPDVVVGPDAFVHQFLTMDLGLRVPDDVGFIMYSNMRDGFACMDQKWQVIGESAVDLVTAMVYHRVAASPEVPRSLIVQGSIVEGPSLPVRQ